MKSLLGSYLMASLSAVLWASGNIIVKVLLNAGVPPLDFVGMRNLSAFVLLLVTVVALHPRLLVIAKKDLPYLAVYGTVGLAVLNLSIAWSVSLIPVSVAILLLHTSPLFILVWSAFSRKERVHHYEITTAFIVILGTGLVVRVYNVGELRINWLGLLMGFFAAVAYAFNTIWGKQGVARFQPVTIMVYGLGFASLVWILAGAPWRFVVASYPVWIWSGTVGVAILGTLFSLWLYLRALRNISSAEANLITSLEPVPTMVLAYALLSERFDLAQLFGAGLLIGGVTYLQLSGIKSRAHSQGVT